jgi:hypothetical protein
MDEFAMVVPTKMDDLAVVGVAWRMSHMVRMELAAA